MMLLNVVETFWLTYTHNISEHGHRSFQQWQPRFSDLGTHIYKQQKRSVIFQVSLSPLPSPRVQHRLIFQVWHTILYNMIYLSVTELLYYIYIIFNIILSHIVCICIGLSPPTLVPRTSRTHLPIPSRSGQPIAKRPAQKDVFNLTRSSTLAGTVHM